MMHLKNVLSTWDAMAMSLNSGQGNKNVYEYNLNLLGLIYHASRNVDGRRILSTVFGFTSDTIDTLQGCSLEDLQFLASDVAIIFALDMDEKEILQTLEKEYNPRIFLSQDVTVGEFDAAYWILMNREASSDPLNASVLFGVSTTLTVAVAQASDAQLRSLRISQPLRFKLRFHQDQIKASLSREMAGVSYLRRMQQTFQQFKRDR